ncbi:MAG: N-acetyltransferase [Sphingomonas sp.]|nr:N-acetyltransferase [Sphingomonas sp.]
MADREAELVARIGRGVTAFVPETWDMLAASDDPFLSHAFLGLLESSSSVGGGTGWTPLPIMAERSGTVVAAAAAYLKSHSQGEYVFDHGWGEAWERSGRAYYPKLQIAVPFTPVPGRRLMGDRSAILSAIEAVTVQNKLSSAHITFCDAGDVDAGEQRGWLRRDGIQFHWFNRDYGSFEDFLGTLSSRKRKVIRKERAAARAGLDLVTLRGAEIQPEHMAAMWQFYQDTGSRKWGQPYLTQAWFDDVVAAMGDAVVLMLAWRDGRPIAGALNFVGKDALYGRYWGAAEEIPFLHFELSYYRAIDFAIAHGLASVQAGAQGEHKLARGYEPVLTHSLHFIPDEDFRRAIADFLLREREAVASEMQWARAALPYRHAD